MVRTTSLICGFVLTSLSVTAQEWPQFRGPGGNNVVTDADFPAAWGADNNLAWKVEIPGMARSSPIVWGDRVFVTTAIEDQAPTLTARRFRGGVYRLEVYCLDLGTGSTLWNKVAARGKPRIATHIANGYASETPVTDGERVYAYFGMTGLFAYDFDGNLVWKKDLGSYQMQRDWGTASSPLLHQGKLYLQIDNEEDSFLVALDPKSGEQLWRIARDEGSNWSTPIIWKNKARVELVTNGKRARSYDPETGKLLWELDIGGGRCSASPTADDELLYLGSETRSTGGGFLFAVKTGASGNITPAEGESTSTGVLWSRAKAGPQMASPLVYQGVVYIVQRNNGILATYDAKTGEEAYKTRLEGAQAFWATPWAYDGKVYCLDDTGTAHVLRPGRQFKMVTRNTLDGEFWASPAIARGALILRGGQLLYCVQR